MSTLDALKSTRLDSIRVFHIPRLQMFSKVDIINFEKNKITISNGSIQTTVPSDEVFIMLPTGFVDSENTPLFENDMVKTATATWYICWMRKWEACRITQKDKNILQRLPLDDFLHLFETIKTGNILEHHKPMVESIKKWKKEIDKYNSRQNTGGTDGKDDFSKNSQSTG